MNQKTGQFAALLAWVTSLAGLLGSLFFSIFMHLPPCDLCWYQRIFMYPLVVVIAVGFLLKDKRMALYALPLSIIGGLIAIYHNLLYYDIIPEKLAPCSQGVSCTDELLRVFGFVDIPLMSLLGFSVITVALFIYHKSQKAS